MIGLARQAHRRCAWCVRWRVTARSVATNLDAEAFPPELFGDLYHPHWRIDEAFKRFKHRLHLEAVSGLSQQALIIDVAAKKLAVADNMTSLMWLATIASTTSPCQTSSRLRLQGVRLKFGGLRRGRA